MTPFIASLYTCALRRPLHLARENASGKFACLFLGLFASVPTFAAEGANVSADAFYSDDVTLTTIEGEPLDINGDGFVDLAVASNQGDEESRWYPGNNDGTFGAPGLLQIGTSSEILGLDLDGVDTFVDLVQGRRDQTSLFYLNTDGMGVNFADDQPITADTNRVLAVAAGDLDGDGDLDLVTGTGHAGGEAGANTGELQLNRFYVNTGIPAGGGAPTFQGGDISATDRHDTRSIALADIDGDMKLDVIVGNDETTTGGNLIYLNTTLVADNVSFAEGVSFGHEDDQTSKILIGDLDNNDTPDVVVLNFIAPPGTAGVGSPGINRFFLNASLPGVVTMGAAQDISPDMNMSSGGALADFDGDLDLDIAVANLVAGPGETSRNRLYLNQFDETGTVSFVGSDISIDEHQSRELAAGDVDSDGDLDIVVANEPFDSDGDGTDDVPGHDRIYLNNGSTTDPFGDSPPPDRGDNTPPAFTSTAVTQATLDVAYTYEIAVSDDDGDAVTIAPAQDLPEWLTLTDDGGGTATLSGTPSADDVGEHAVSIQASDGTDATTQDFTITVSETPVGNSSPEFTSTAVTAATEGEAYAYDITASDADSGATLTITAPTLPGWLTLADNGDGTATLSGTPAASDVGEHEVSLQVSDGTDTAVQDFTVTVQAAGGGGGGGDGGGGGGGSLGLWSLFALMALGLAARRRRTG